MNDYEPEGWPGLLLREGKTLLRVPKTVKEENLGPHSKKNSSVFYNPAMAGSRTRSVLLLNYAINSGIFGEGEVYALDGLAATGLRARRWLNELPLSSTNRLRVEMVDNNPESLLWAKKINEELPPINGTDNLNYTLGDLRKVVLNSGRHWVDIDPFGSPVPFIDSAIQSMARVGILEISATDSAALTGSSKNPLVRRYGARVKTDGLAQDSGLRVLLANVARIAAKYDRKIEPLMSIWDSHHLRISIKVTKSIEAANKVENSLGWRVYSPDEVEIASSVDPDLNFPLDGILPMNCFLPLYYPKNYNDNRFSGPLWTGAIGDSEVMSYFTTEEALRLCGPIYDENDIINSSHKDIERERKAIEKSVRNLMDESRAIDCDHHIVVDDLASWLKLGSPPSPRKMVERLENFGYRAALTHYGRPSFRTNATWEAIVECAMYFQPPI